jgi:hypothetical protein
MSSKDVNQPVDSQPVPTPTPRFVGLRNLFKSFSSPDTKPSPIPSDPEPEPEPPQSDSPVDDDDEQRQTKDQDDVESVASPTPFQRFWRHARTRSTGLEESPSSKWSEPSVTTEHASPSPTLSKSPSTAAEELEAVSPMPTGLITSPERVSDSNPLNGGECPTPASLAQRIYSIISSTGTPMYQPMALESPTTPGDKRTLPQSPAQGPPNLLSPMADSRLLSFMQSPKVMNSPGLGQPSVFSMLERLQSPLSRNRELPPEGGQHGNGMEVVDDGSSLMLCSPLIPQRDSLVEIAETEYVSFDDVGRRAAESLRSPLRQAHAIDNIDEEDDDERKNETHQTSTDGDRGEGVSQTVEGDSVENDVDDNNGENQPNDPSGTVSRSIFRWPWSKTEEEKCAERKAKEKAEGKAKEEQKLVWVPSPTNISLQTMWWGYRMSVNFKHAAL